MDFLYAPFVREATISPIKDVIPTGLNTNVKDEMKVEAEVNKVCLPVKTRKGFGKYSDQDLISGAKWYSFAFDLCIVFWALDDKETSKSKNIGPIAIPKKKLILRCLSSALNLSFL